MNQAKLTVGLLLDNARLPAWACRMIEIIREGDYAEVVLIVRITTCDAPEDEPKDTLVRRVLHALQRFLIGKPGSIVSALEIDDNAELFDGVATINVTSRRVEDRDCIDEPHLSEIQKSNIDVLIQLSSLTLGGEIFRAARHGIWSCEFGAAGSGQSLPSGYWEVVESRPETQSEILIRTSESEQAYIAYRSFSSTVVMSLEDNASNVLWKSLYFIPQLLQELHQEGEKKFFSARKGSNVCPEFCDSRRYAVPSNQRLAMLLWRKFRQKAARNWRKLFYLKQWFLLYDFGKNQSESYLEFKQLTPPKDRFWADPFVIFRDGKHYVFFEECLFSDNRGHISVIVLAEDGTVEDPVCVLQKPYHLSYPFIFEHNHDLYMIPETIRNRTVELYKCTDFPSKWVFQKNLRVGCSVVDTTLLYWDGKWWMFANALRDGRASTWDELCLFYSDSPLSDQWTAHPKNPIVSDVKSSRPAGRIIQREGRLYRPSQNSSRHYGYGFNICEITKLTETDYEEKIVSRVEPNWDKNIVSTHTMNYESGLTVIDGQRWRKKYFWMPKTSTVCIAAESECTPSDESEKVS